MKIALSFVAAFLLMLVPVPGWAEAYRPDWVVLVLVYWCLAQPDRMGPVAGWIVGLMVDIMQANLLGLNALGMALVGYLANRFHRRLLMFPWWQQAASVLFMLLLYRALVGWIRGFTTTVDLDWSYWAPCLAGMLVWPLLYLALAAPTRLQRAR